VSLLDRTSDASTTAACSPSRRARAGERRARRLVAESIHEIDMEAHRGEHPRIGAVDVVPFVPLATRRLDDCIGFARAFGERIAGAYDVPVYLYAAAARRPERVKLADVRRGQ
jgi:glutamate formiminotransferase